MGIGHEVSIGQTTILRDMRTGVKSRGVFTSVSICFSTVRKMPFDFER